jgi:hypothetical protein
VGEEIAGVEPFLGETVKADAPCRAGEIAEEAAVADEGLEIDHRVDARPPRHAPGAQRVADERRERAAVDGVDVLRRDDVEHLQA